MELKTATRSGKYLILSGLLGMSMTSAFALPSSVTEAAPAAIVQQNVKLKGVVLDANTGEPIIGANVLVKGTTNGTITNIDGEYALDIPQLGGGNFTDLLHRLQDLGGEGLGR